MSSKEAKREYDRQYRARPHVRKNKALQERAKRASDPEYIRGKARDRYIKNRETILARHKEWRLRNQAKFRQARGQIGPPTRLEPDACECCGLIQNHKLCEDHNHETGLFRGWLCRTCNCAIGFLGDSLSGAEAAVRYLRSVSN